MSHIQGQPILHLQITQCDITNQHLKQLLAIPPKKCIKFFCSSKWENAFLQQSLMII